MLSNSWHDPECHSLQMQNSNPVSLRELGSELRPSGEHEKNCKCQRRMCWCKPYLMPMLDFFVLFSAEIITQSFAALISTSELIQCCVLEPKICCKEA